VTVMAQTETLSACGQFHMPSPQRRDRSPIHGSIMSTMPVTAALHSSVNGRAGRTSPTHNSERLHGVRPVAYSSPPQPPSAEVQQMFSGRRSPYPAAPASPRTWRSSHPGVQDSVIPKQDWIFGGAWESSNRYAPDSRPVWPTAPLRKNPDALSIPSLNSEHLHEANGKITASDVLGGKAMPTDALEKMRLELRDICGSMATRNDHMNGHIENFERTVYERLQALESQFGDIFDSGNSAGQSQLAETPSAATAVHGFRSELGDSTSAWTPESAHPTGTTTTPNEALPKSDGWAHEPNVGAKEKMGSVESLDDVGEELEIMGDDCKVVELIVVKNSLSDNLGMEVKHIDGHLCVNLISEGGAVARANKESSAALPPGEILKVGDVIFRVNDITEPDSAMIAECQEKSLLRIHAMRL